MSSLKVGFVGSVAALAMALPASAQGYGYNGYNGYDDYGYQQPTYHNSGCEAARRSNQTAGGLLGAVAGGLIGAAIADDDDDRHRHRGHRYSRGWDRGYGYGYRGRGHHRHKGNGDQVAGAVIGAIVGGVAGSAIGGSATNCNQAPRQVYNAPPQQPRQVYGGQYGSQPYGYNNRQQATYGSTDYGYDGYGNEELYGSRYDPHYGATTTGYNAGYTQSYDSGECRTVYRDRYVNGQRVSEPATACNVGGDRWEFVD